MKKIAIVGLCLLAASCGSGRRTPGAHSVGGSGIDGVVLAGPTCPVERVGSPCPDQPVSARLKIVDGHGNVVAELRTAADGSFHIDVTPGRYTIEDADAVPPSGAPSEVEVVASQRAHATLHWDTGIR